MAITEPEPTVADVMLRKPKTLPADVTVADAREAFENQSVQMLLLVDGTTFRGALTVIPADARPDAPARDFAASSPPSVTEDMPVSEALDQLERRPSGRLVVLKDEDLVGLVCLAKDGVTFCGTPGSMS